uniref:High-affinity nitrate transporter n=1 Tax=Oryza punctata TaxID=4537 RepID=A0A0E0KRY0_ORYPU
MIVARFGVVASVFLPLLLLVLGSCHVAPAAAVAAAGVRLSALAKTLVVEASPRAGQVLHAGEDTITVTWSLNAAAAGADDGYKTVKVTLCYAPASQEGRGWRKAHDDLSKDKACQFKIAQQPYDAGDGAGKFDYTVARDVPTASYYVRAYALDASGTQVAYGETAPAASFAVAGITGVTASIEVAAGVLSVFSVAALAVFLVLENRKKNR